MSVMTKIRRNKKNGRLYVMHAIVTDSTNGHKNKNMVLYSPEEECGAFMLFVRDEREFNEKFELVKIK